ncbi:MAG TPA: AGE family epimerase/isomerase [Methylorubrum populi]|uniref:AGE family epimerase/isomerase n=1 Tax=Methylorubrum populi TaxID=223967 RepID=A0A921JEZ2_9HYPH|nr:AGE family epimerase/isomerase [Methylorubrum populi]
MRPDLVAWLRESALPLWAGSGFDRRTGLFHEALDRDARPIDGAARRLMVQARQIHVFALAEIRGWYPGGECAERAAQEMLACFMDQGGGGGFAFSVDADGAVRDSGRDLYAQAFALFALAWMARLTGRSFYLDIADATLNFLDTRMALPETGGYRESLPEGGGGRRQNPHMHLVEALLALHEACPDRGYAGRAGQLIGLMERRFLQGAGRVLVEFYDERLVPLQTPPYAFEPGHHFEWAWLLTEHARLTARPVPTLARHLYQVAEATVALDGSIPDLTDEEGNVRAGTTRLWPHTEALRAAMLAWTPRCATGRAHWRENVIALLFARFLGPAHQGCWIDRTDEEGHPLSLTVPASSLYHLVGAACRLAQFDRVGRDQGDAARASQSRWLRPESLLPGLRLDGGPA